jgi:hypothetical protein
MMKRIRKTEQGVAGCFDPHHEAARSMFGIFKEKTGKKFQYFFRVKVICVTERAVHIETQAFIFGTFRGMAQLYQKGYTL